MNISVLRYNSAKDHTNSIILIDNKYQCFGLEDEHRTTKVSGETRIPDGEYNVTLRLEGGFHSKYLTKFGASFHKGMLWVRDVPGFEYILIHIGNTDEDTAGCLLVAESNTGGSNMIGDSTTAYKNLYPKVRDAILAGEPVTITYLTLDNTTN